MKSEMKQVSLSTLVVGDTFKFFVDGCSWVVIDQRPSVYFNCVRASSGRVTSPFNRNILVFV